MALAIKNATMGDKDAWMDLFVAYLEFYGTSRSEEVIETTWQRILAPAEPMNSLIAFTDDRAVGIANYLFHRHFWQIEDACYLNDLFVTPDARGLGAGQKLIEACLKQARAKGCDKIYWTTGENNTQARALYDKIGELTPFIKYQKLDE